MKTQTDKTSLEYRRGGITVRIRPTVKDGVARFVADYRVKGVRKLAWRSTLADARAVASAAVEKIVARQAEVLQLTNADVHIYLRSRDTAAALNKPLDQLVIECADAMQVLAGRASLMDVCREWEKRHDRRVRPGFRPRLAHRVCSHTPPLVLTACNHPRRKSKCP